MKRRGLFGVAFLLVVSISVLSYAIEWDTGCGIIVGESRLKPMLINILNGLKIYLVIMCLLDVFLLVRVIKKRIKWKQFILSTILLGVLYAGPKYVLNYVGVNESYGTSGDVKIPENCDYDERETPLSRAVYHNRREEVENLLNKGMNPNIKGYNGNTSLHWAFMKKEGVRDEMLRKSYEEIIQLLLKYGADPSIKNDDGKTPKEVQMRHIWK